MRFEELLTRLEDHDVQHANYVRHRFYVGHSHVETAEIMGLSRRQADRIWTMARTWFKLKLKEEND